MLLVDVSGSMRANDVEPTRLDAARRRDADVPRQAAEAVQGRPRRVQLRAGGAGAADAPTATVDPRRARLPRAGGGDGDRRRARRSRVQHDQASLAREAGSCASKGEALPAAIVLAVRRRAEPRHRLQPLQAAQARARGRDPGLRASRSARRTARSRSASALFVELDPGAARPGRRCRRSRATTGGKSYTAQSSAQLSSVYQTLGSSLGRRTRAAGDHARGSPPPRRCCSSAPSRPASSSTAACR